MNKINPKFEIRRKPVPYWILSETEKAELESLQSASKIEKQTDRFELVADVEFPKRPNSVRLIEVRPQSPIARLEKLGRRISRIF